MATTATATAKFNTPEPVLESVTLELTPEAAEVLFGQIAGFHCTPVKDLKDSNWHLYLAFKNAGVPKGELYQKAYKYAKKGVQQ